jgi:2,3-bisphosphoglycerate-independent phosphoglycerate mutase
LVDVHDGLCSTQEGKELARDLNEVMGADGFHFIHLQGPMGILLSDHPEMVAAVQASRSLNPIDCLGQNYPSATTGICENPAVTELCVRISEALSAHSINELRADLEEDPINAAIFYGGGPLFRTAKQRGDVFLLSPVAESIGVAKSLGCQTLYLDEETQRFDWVRRSVADIKTWTARSQELVVEWPYVWNSTFKGDLLEKIKTIEWLDKHGLAPLLQLCREENLDLRVLSLRAVDIRDGSITAGMTSLWTSRKGAPVSHWSQVLPEQRPATAAKA